MDQSFLKLQSKHKATLKFFFGIAILFGVQHCTLFNDLPLELDPNVRDSTLMQIAKSENHPVSKNHLLESFGSFGCVSCPEAELRLSQYLHVELGNPAYNPRVFIVNYHVKFGTVPDAWVTPKIQALYDANGYTSLPQVVMDGSNATYGIREKDASFKSGDYDSLVVRAIRGDSMSWLEIKIDANSLVYDTVESSIQFQFHVQNHGNVVFEPLDFQVLAIKNQSVSIPIYPTPWEAIGVETTDKDATGKALSLAGLQPLTDKVYPILLTLSPEAPKHVRPPPLGPEPLSNYAILVFARNRQGIIQNVQSLKYRPLFTPKAQK